MAEEITIKCIDGHPLATTLYEASEPKGIVIIASAIGIQQSYYSRFAEFLSQCNYSVITFDYRGTGKSCTKNPSGLQLSDWGSKDINAVILFAKDKNLPLFFIGHSIGGQILGLADSSRELSGIVFVAASAPYWKRWSFPENSKMLVASKIIFPIVSSIREIFPMKKFGLGNQDIPSPFIKTWGQWMTKPDYLFDQSFKLNVDNYESLDKTILFMGFTDDKLAPEANIEKLMDFYPNSKQSLKMISPASVNVSSIGHTGFFREKFKFNLWQSTLNKINDLHSDSRPCEQATQT